MLVVKVKIATIWTGSTLLNIAIYLANAMKKPNTPKKNIRPNLYDYLKVVAILTMIVDHLGYYLFPEVLELRLIGRVAFPIFLFLVGFNGSFRWRWELFWRGIGLWVITAGLSFSLGFGNTHANILITILLARMLMEFLEKKKKIWLFIMVFLVLAIGHFWLKERLDYGALGFFFVLRGRLAKKWKSWWWRGFPILIWLFIQNIQVFDFWVEKEECTLILFLWTAYLGIFVSFFTLQKSNSSLLWKKRWNQLILWISRSALVIYGVHIMVLILLSLWKWGILSK